MFAPSVIQSRLSLETVNLGMSKGARYFIISGTYLLLIIQGVAVGSARRYWPIFRVSVSGEKGFPVIRNGSSLEGTPWPPEGMMIDIT